MYSNRTRTFSEKEKVDKVKVLGLNKESPMIGDSYLKTRDCPQSWVRDQPLG